METPDAAQSDTPSWWERSGLALSGPFLDRLVLAGDSPEERRIQAIRAGLTAGSRPKLSIHRARLFTAGYRANPGLPPVLRRAMAIARVLEEIPIALVPGQLLAGTPSAGYGAIEIDPEYATPWLLAPSPEPGCSQLRYLPLRPFMPVDIDSEDLRELEQDILPYWRKRSLGARITAALAANAPDTLAYMGGAGVFMANYGKGFSHTIQDYRTVAERGFAGLIAEIETAAAAVAAAPASRRDLERLDNYRAMAICARATSAYSDRLAEACRGRAGEIETADPVRAAELRALAAVCNRVPRGPSATWHEALQAVHLAHMTTFLAEGGVSHSLGRMDSYLYPLYRRQIEEQGLSPARAQELLECFFLKRYEFQSVRDHRSARGLAGDRTNDKITLGGQDRHGHDASTPLTYRFLEAQAHVHLKEPNLSLRLHPATPPRLLEAALDVLRLGSGLPQLINDAVIIPALTAVVGLDRQSALEYADIGCQENGADPNGPANADANGHNNGGFFNLPKVLELTLAQGIDRRTGRRHGPDTTAPAACAAMDDFLAAFTAQLDCALNHYAAMNTACEHCYATAMTTPYHDLMHPGPRRTGRGYVDGGCRYNWISAVGVGLATLADSFMVIDELLYRQRTVAWDELLAALADDWRGHEGLRGRILALPHYGAGGTLAETWAARLAALFADRLAARPIPRGEERIPFAAGFFSMGINLVLGEDVAATPDGRVSGEALSGSVAPSRLAARLGHTATHLAAAGLDTTRLPNGVILNEVIAASTVAGERGTAKWADLVRGFFRLGGSCVQYSVASREAFLAAKANPEAHRDLIVRLGGYSARFVDLAPELQDDFIARLETS
ncbi:pyruvate formate lyase family protein [Solidesulfovibrio sp.]